MLDALKEFYTLTPIMVQKLILVLFNKIIKSILHVFFLIIYYALLFS